MCGMLVKPNKVTNMQKAIGKFVNHPTRTGKRLYDKFYIYVPTQVAKDGTFPFKGGSGRVRGGIAGRRDSGFGLQAKPDELDDLP